LTRHAVCVYCGSFATVPPRFLDVAHAVGKGIADRGWSLVWGGGRTSMMGALARAARENGARTVGVIPRALVAPEIADHDADELLVVDTMRERKELMDAHANAFLALPGGLGTCEELFEVWTSRYLAMHERRRRPLVGAAVLGAWAARAGLRLGGLARRAHRGIRCGQRAGRLRTGRRMTPRGLVGRACCA